ncbi:hypothetical protein QCW82_004493 [Klebsiella michiganensis]|uniref:hypothetical protein n=1 Tax=Klebsiella michiganensis TaxID=1134687 RepID=UPI00198186AF|nr:hypothetical protein [Klebsiella michiganensis]EKV4192820.1 hypothetical protein [Klebsiella michiganensis]MBN4044220.1 hypothetical protein [Klebsiella michiganensis]
MSDKQTETALSEENQQYIFTTKANLLAELIIKQMPTKSEAEELAKMVNSAFEKLTA